MTTPETGEIFFSEELQNESGSSSCQNFSRMTTVTNLGIGDAPPPPFPDTPKFVCACSKSFQCRQNLYRHKKKCAVWAAAVAPPATASLAESPTDNVSLEVGAVPVAAATAALTPPSDPLILDEIQQLRKEVQELQSRLGQEKSVIINNNNNNNNYYTLVQNNVKFDIRNYLNNDCKDALNLGDFVNRINVTLEDIYYTGTNGYVKGMCNVLMKHLGELDETERPFHCTDKRRLKFFVKQDGEWCRDEDNRNITDMMSRVTDKHINQLKEWKSLHPDWTKNEDLSKEYLTITSNILDGVRDETGKKYIRSVLQSISNMTALSRKDGRED